MIGKRIILTGTILLLMASLFLSKSQVSAQNLSTLGFIPTKASIISRSTPESNIDAWEWVEGSVWYTSIIDWMGYVSNGFGAFVGYYQNAVDGYPYVNSVYYIKVVVYGISSPQAGTMSAYITFILPPNTTLAISYATPMFCYGGESWQQFSCDFTLEEILPGQYAIPSGEYGNVWPIAAGAGWEFQIPVRTSTTLNNSNFISEITNIDGYQTPPKLYPSVPIYVWLGSTTAPAAFNKYLPANTASNVSLNENLSWYESAGALTYEYCYDTSNDSACSNWVDYSTPIAPFSPNTTYYWQVRAVNDYGTTYADGSASAFWSFRTTGSVSLPVAFNKVGPGNGATGVPINPTLSWGSSTGSQYYEYCIDTTNDADCSIWLTNSSQTSKGLSGLLPGTTYYWQVRAVNNDGTTYANGSASAFWSFTTAGTASPPGVFNKTGPGNAATGVSVNPTLNWGSSTGAQYYEYCLDTTNDNDCSSLISNNSQTSKQLSGLLPGTTYYWQVRAVNIGGITYANGSPGAFWSFTTSATQIKHETYLPLIRK